MAGFVPNEYRALLLESIAGKTTLTSSAMYLGLARTLPEDPYSATLSTIIEVTTAGYARKTVPAFNAASVEDPVQIVEPTEFSFNALTEDMEDFAYYAFLTDAASGTVGKIHYVFELPSPIQGRSGEAIRVPAESLIIE